MGRLEHFYHGTDEESVAPILKEGFSLKHAGSNGTDYGVGVYATTDKGWAAEHAFGIEGGRGGKVMGVTINAKNPFKGGDIPDHIVETAKGMSQQDFVQRQQHVRSRGYDPAKVEPYGHKHFIPDALVHHGHDAWIHDGMAVVYDPKRIKPTGETWDEEQMYPGRHDYDDAEEHDGVLYRPGEY